MRILMMTNTFLPHVGGVARSVESFVSEYRAMGHETLVVAPEFDGAPKREDGVIRLPAIQNFNGSDFSVQIPLSGIASSSIARFNPDIVHSHHPFMIGDTAWRVAVNRKLPLVFTHHTMYEQYTHYVPGDSAALKRFVVKLTTGYSNLCDCVIAPSESVAATLLERDIQAPIEVIPTGVRLARFARGKRLSFRREMGIPPKAFVVGHLGRLAPEKNIGFLIQAVAPFLWRNSHAHFLIIGKGPEEARIRDFFDNEGMGERVHMAGVRQGSELAAAYHAMDVFAFASKSETQGLVLAEAMAAGLPVVALDAPGAREMLRDEENGHLIPTESVYDFATSLHRVAAMSPARLARMKQCALKTAKSYSMRRCAKRALALYERLLHTQRVSHPKEEEDVWTWALRMIKAEWDHLQTLTGAAGAALSLTEVKGPELK